MTYLPLTQLPSRATSQCVDAGTMAPARPAFDTCPRAQRSATGKVDGNARVLAGGSLS
jgi:hypothetical protein